MLDVSVLLVKALPPQQYLLNTLKLLGCENAKTTQKILGWNRLNALNQKCAFGKESCGHRNLEL